MTRRNGKDKDFYEYNSIVKSIRTILEETDFEITSDMVVAIHLGEEVGDKLMGLVKRLSTRRDVHPATKAIFGIPVVIDETISPFDIVIHQLSGAKTFGVMYDDVFLFVKQSFPHYVESFEQAMCLTSKGAISKCLNP